MKKKMVCLALFSTLGLSVYSLPAQAATDEYLPTMEDVFPNGMEEETLPPGYEFELEETDQPFVGEEPYPVEEGDQGVMMDSPMEEQAEVMENAGPAEQIAF